jgi:hypothetical protein
MHVWIVTKGEEGQGAGIEAVTATLARARSAARKLAASSFGDWTEDGKDRWTNGCDVVEVERHEVQGAKW